MRVLVTNHLTRPILKLLKADTAKRVWRADGYMECEEDLQRALEHVLRKVKGYTQDEGTEQHIHTSKSLLALIGEVDLQRAQRNPDAQHRARHLIESHRDGRTQRDRPKTLTRADVKRLMEYGLVSKWAVERDPRRCVVRRPVPTCCGGDDPPHLINLFDEIFDTALCPGSGRHAEQHRGG